MKELENIGSIAKTSMADGWVEMPREPDVFTDTWSRSFTLAFDPSVELLFFSRGLPVDPDSAAFFKEVTSLKPAHGADDKLTPQEIIRLQVIMGFENAGNNQYTNTKPLGDPDGPAFELKEAACRRIGDHTVLYVRGKFVHGKHYAGILYNAAERSGLVFEEVMIQASSSRKLQDNMYHFEHVINNIDWLKRAVPQEATPG